MPARLVPLGSAGLLPPAVPENSSGSGRLLSGIFLEGAIGNDCPAPVSGASFGSGMLCARESPDGAGACVRRFGGRKESACNR